MHPQENANGRNGAHRHFTRQPEPVELVVRGNARERDTHTLPRVTQECCLEGRRRSAAETFSSAQFGWSGVPAHRRDQSHRAGDGDDRRDPLGDGRMGRKCALMRAVDHHGVLPGAEAGNAAATLDAA